MTRFSKCAEPIFGKSPPPGRPLCRLAEIFGKSGAKLYAVGGTVRNPLLGFPVTDSDICSALPMQQAASLLNAHSIPFFEKGAAFGTLDISFLGERFEYAPFRAESYDGTGAHRPSSVSFFATLEQDAFRRDFTVNALYLDPLSNSIVDPTGGFCDLEKKLLRATSADPDTIMRDDGLRILRMARFAGQLGFSVEENTLLAARRNSQNLKHISPERIFLELSKLLLADAAYGAGEESLLYALHILRDSGAIEVLFGELAACDNIAQRAQYHAYDVLEHSLRSCSCSAARLSIRLAMLFHDVGKAAALSSHGNMHGHDIYSAQMAFNILERLRAPVALRDNVVKLIRHHMYDLRGEARPRTLKKQFVRFGRDFVNDLIAVREADVHGSGRISGPVETAERWKSILGEMTESGAPFTQAQLNFTGEDICRCLSIPPGPMVGEIKQKLLLHCACKPADNTPQRLAAIAKTIFRGQFEKGGL